MSDELYTFSEPGEAESQQQAGPLALDIKRLIALRFPLMFAVAVVVAIPAAVTAWLITPIVYTATAELRFYASTPTILEEGGGGAPRGSYDQYVSTQIGYITAPYVLEDVVARLDTEEMVSLPAEADAAVTALQSAVSARTRGRSELVDVQCTLPSPEEAKQVLDVVLEEYLEFAAEAESSDVNTRLTTLASERDTLELRLRQQTDRIAAQERELGIAGVGSEDPKMTELSQYREKKLDMEQRVAEMGMALREQESVMASIEALQAGYEASPDAPINERNVEGKVAEDPDVQAYRGLLLSAEIGLSQVRQTYRPSHPNYAEAEKLLKLRQDEMDRFKRDARGRVLQSMASEARFMLARLEENIAEAGKRVDEYETEIARIKADMQGEMDQQSRQLSELNQLKQQASDTRAQLTVVIRSIETIQREEKAPARVRKTANARVPTSPNYKKHIMMVLMALVGSGGLGVGVGVLRELTDHQLRSSKDLTRLTPLPVIASIPHADSDEFVQAANVPLLTMDHPSSMAADEYRRILSRMLYPPEEMTEISSLLVASASSGDGKTSLACNLAIALTQAHRQVLLLDISSQQPAIEGCFGLTASTGLAELLREESAPEQCLRETDYEGLYVMGPGVRVKDLASRLASRRMTDFLEWAEQRFDHVIIDSPPSLLMSDAKLLAPLTDGVIVVVGVGVSTVGMVRRCLQEMEQLKANVLGVVLNGIRPMRGGYLKRRRRLFYAYYQGAGNGQVADNLPEMEVVEEEDSADAVAPEEPVVVLLPADDEEPEENRR